MIRLFIDLDNTSLVPSLEYFAHRLGNGYTGTFEQYKKDYVNLTDDEKKQIALVIDTMAVRQYDIFREDFIEALQRVMIPRNDIVSINFITNRSLQLKMYTEHFIEQIRWMSDKINKVIVINKTQKADYIRSLPGYKMYRNILFDDYRKNIQYALDLNDSNIEPVLVRYYGNSNVNINNDRLKDISDWDIETLNFILNRMV